MSLRPFLLIAVACLPIVLCAQNEKPAHYQLFGGYTFLSNSPNGLQGEHQPLNGWDTSIEFPPWNNLRFKMEYSEYIGTNLGASQKPFYIMAGGQYSQRLGKESVYVEGLFGNVGINRYWGPNQLTGDTASFATFFGGGVDTPINRRFAFRVGGDYVWSNLSLIQSVSYAAPYTYPGLPRYFGRVNSGIVWKF